MLQARDSSLMSEFVVRLLGVIGIIAVSTACATVSGLPSSAIELTDLRLDARNNGIRQDEIYEPVEVVMGAEQPEPLPRRKTASIAPEAFAEATRYLERHGPSVLMVWHKGAIVYEASIEGADLDELRDSYSMHKTLVALLIGAAIADGKIASVEEPAANYIPEWRNDARSKIRIIDLLRMSAGIERQRLSFKAPYNLETLMLFGDDVWGPALARGVVVPPQQEFHYNNVETQLLGIILTRAVGERYANYLSRKLWKPLGATDGRLWLDKTEGKPRVYCCFMSRPEDWVRVGILFLEHGQYDGRQLIPEDWMRQMVEPSPLNPGYGYQVWLGANVDMINRSGSGSAVGYSASFMADDIVFLTGFGSQRTYVVPSCDLVIVRMGEGAKGEWDQAALPNAIIKGLKGSHCTH